MRCSVYPSGEFLFSFALQLRSSSLIPSLLGVRVLLKDASAGWMFTVKSRRFPSNQVTDKAGKPGAVISRRQAADGPGWPVQEISAPGNQPHGETLEGRSSAISAGRETTHRTHLTFSPWCTHTRRCWKDEHYFCGLFSVALPTTCELSIISLCWVTNTGCLFTSAWDFRLVSASDSQ